MPVVSDLQRVTQDFRNRLLTAEQGAIATMTDAYQQAWGTVQGRLDGVLADMQQAYDAGEDLSAWRVREHAQLEKLLSDIRAEIDAFAYRAQQAMEQQSQDAPAHGSQFAQAALSSTVPPGVSRCFSAVAPEAVYAQMGRFEPGSP
ncbi:MAG: hypothetical protein IVW57_17825, partial [Ktedonobacterales bacterium]|nr:hypothetical protein [Ktedonobacterales bacterium]